MGYKSVEGLLTEQSVKRASRSLAKALLTRRRGSIRQDWKDSLAPYPELCQGLQHPHGRASDPGPEAVSCGMDVGTADSQTFNSFFARKLLATARPIASLDDPTVVTSPADCRLSVFESVESAKQLWIKGQEFTIPKLLLGDDTSDTRFESVLKENSFALAVCRLAPQDYHRFHSPFNGVIIDVKNYAGELYTVNPQGMSCLIH